MQNEISTTTPSLMDELSITLKAEPASRHSYFQLKYFVIGKEPTTQAKMWQCLREMKSRKDALTALDMEVDESGDRLALLDIAIKRHLKSGWSASQDEQEQAMNEQEYRIKHRRLLRKKKAAEENLALLTEKKKWLEDEARFFLESFKNLEKVEKLKPFDDLEAQKQYWGNKLADKINLKMLLQQPLDIELTETILALPDDIPVKTQMVNRLNSIQSQLLEVKEEYRKRLEAAKPSQVSLKAS